MSGWAESTEEKKVNLIADVTLTDLWQTMGDNIITIQLRLPKSDLCWYLDMSLYFLTVGKSGFVSKSKCMYRIQTWAEALYSNIYARIHMLGFYKSISVSLTICLFCHSFWKVLNWFIVYNTVVQYISYDMNIFSKQILCLIPDLYSYMYWVDIVSVTSLTYYTYPSAYRYLKNENSKYTTTQHKNNKTRDITLPS